ncbi:hypothetical protein [Legionella fairfieldensis]|uniref:hypothetical protein n=1 Tax=Legionella fairfieldensis TaxID=45064 RepID=UPI00048AA289|nr:hypothetical protein [Legionella fairfieldensis]
MTKGKLEVNLNENEVNLNENKVTQIHAVEGSYNMVAIRQDSSRQFNVMGYSLSGKLIKKFGKGSRYYVKEEEYCEKPALDDERLKIMPNGFYFYNSFNNSFLTSIYYNGSQELSERLAPDLCTTLNERSSRIELICASEDRKALYSYSFDRYTNHRSFIDHGTENCEESINLRDGEVIFQVKKNAKDIEINSLASLHPKHKSTKVIVAFNNGTIVSGETGGKVVWKEIPSLSELELSDAQLYDSESNLLTVYSKNKGVLAIYDPENKNLATYSCPQLSNTHLSGNYFTGLFQDPADENKNKVFIFSLKSGKYRIKELPVEETTDLLVLNDETICLVADNEVYFVKNFLKNISSSPSFFNIPSSPSSSADPAFLPASTLKGS